MLGPTEGQKADLVAGVAVKLSPEHLDGDFPLHLTGTQMKKLKAARGFTLKLSQAQIKYNAKHGSGIFGDILRTVGHHGTDWLVGKTGLGVGAGWPGDPTKKPPNWPGKPARAPTMQRGLDNLLSPEALAALIAKHVPQMGKGGLSDFLGSMGLGAQPKKKGKGIIGDALRWAGRKGTDILVDKTGLGIKEIMESTSPGPIARRGKGFLGDALKWAGRKGTDILVDKTGLGVGQEIDRTPIHPTHAFLGVSKKKGAGLYM